MSHREKYPNMHIYHYAPYEPAALRRLARKYNTREKAVDTLIKERVLVDVYPIVKQSLIVGEPKTSLKNVEKVLHAIDAQPISNPPQQDRNTSATPAASSSTSSQSSSSSSSSPTTTSSTGRGNAKVATAVASVQVYGTWMQTRRLTSNNPDNNNNIMGNHRVDGSSDNNDGAQSDEMKAGEKDDFEPNPPIDPTAGYTSPSYQWKSSEGLKDIRYYNAVDCANLMRVVEYVSISPLLSFPQFCASYGNHLNSCIAVSQPFFVLITSYFFTCLISSLLGGYGRFNDESLPLLMCPDEKAWVVMMMMRVVEVGTLKGSPCLTTRLRLLLPPLLLRPLLPVRLVRTLRITPQVLLLANVLERVRARMLIALSLLLVTVTAIVVVGR